jgi:hypothetical protein
MKRILSIASAVILYIACAVVWFGAITVLVHMLSGCRENQALANDAAIDEQDTEASITPCTQLTLQAASTWGVSLQFIVHCRYGVDGRTFTVVSELEAPMSLVDTPAYQECTRPGQVLFSAELCDLENQEQLEYIRGW